LRRGELYLVKNPVSSDPKRQRVYVVVSREELIQSNYSTLVSAPVFSNYLGLLSEVLVGTQEGLKHNSSIHCDNLVSVAKEKLTHYVGSLTAVKLAELDAALVYALSIGAPTT
jgi:mRNA interferase MazF